MFRPFVKGVGLALSPQGRKVIRKGVAVARSKEARTLMASARKVAASPESRRLMGHAVRVASQAGNALRTPESRERLRQAATRVIAERRR